MFAATFELFNFQQTSSNDLQNQIQAIRGKADAIHVSAEKLVTLENGLIATELLINLDSRNQQSFNLAFSLVALQIQAQVLKSGCFFHYFIQVKKLFDAISSEVACTYVAEVEEMFRSLVESAVANEATRSIIKTLRKMIDLSCPNKNTFSLMYAYFLQACIKGQMYGVALDFIRQREVFEITEKANSCPEEFLKYFYYSGICHISEKNYQAALESFLTCVTTPCNTLSQVIINAIKKCKLVSLLASGEKFLLPRYTSTTVNRFFFDDMQPYDLIVDKFSGDDVNELANIIHSNETSLKADNNFGIAKQLISSWKFNKIRNISKSFISLSLGELAEAMNMKEGTESLERAIFEMISAEKMVASIHSTEGIISFEDTPLTERTFAKQKKLLGEKYEEAMNQIVLISDLLRESQKEVLTSTDYIQKEMPKSRGMGSSTGSGNLWGVASTMEFV